jgi:hypothetical protein
MNDRIRALRSSTELKLERRSNFRTKMLIRFRREVGRVYREREQLV